MKSLTRLLALLALTTVVVSSLFAQPTPATPTPFTSGLLAPTKIIFTPRGNLMVAEQGNGPNTGRISIIDRSTGTPRALISGLPSGINPLGAQPAPSGPDGLALSANVLYVTIGSGDAPIAGPLPGTEVPNPNPPSSPILSSLLALDSRLPIEDLTGGFTLTRSQHDQLKAGQSISFGTGFQTLTIRLIADFPDLVFDPRPDFPGNFRSSNPFGVAVRGETAYVVDASQNLIRAVNIASGAYSTLAVFPKALNNTGIGAPQVDPVPDSIQFFEGQLLVTTLTGFPFPPGSARVYAVDPNTGLVTQKSGGHTSAIDVTPLRSVTGNETYMVLEFSRNQRLGEPGRLTSVTGASGFVVAAPLISPTSMASDLVRGEIFITQIFTGQVVRVLTAGVLPAAVPPSVIPIVASAPGVGGSRFETSVQLTNPYDFPIAGSLVLRSNGGPNDPAIPYSLAPRASVTFNNIMTSFGRTGIGSIDILPSIGPPPVAATRVFESGTGNGFFQQPVSSEQVISAGRSVALIAPSDLTTFRMNIGVRTFSAGATLRVTVYHANGSTGPVASHTLVPNTVTQMTAAQFVDGALQPGDSIAVDVVNGSAIIYGSIIHNQTQASSIQIPIAVLQ